MVENLFQGDRTGESRQNFDQCRDIVRLNGAAREPDEFYTASQISNAVDGVRETRGEIDISTHTVTLGDSAANDIYPFGGDSGDITITACDTITING